MSSMILATGRDAGVAPALTAAGVLAAARRARIDADAAEAEVLTQAGAWARLHLAEHESDAATWGDSPVPIAGEGAPQVSEFCIAEMAAVLGMSTEAGRRLIAHAVELEHRLPRTWARVCAGSLAPWRARRVADATLSLGRAAAAYVDEQVAAFAHRVGPAQLARLVDEAIARFDPARADAERTRAADGRHFDIDHGQVSYAGTCQVWGELDLPDALDLDAAVAAGAEQLKAFGSAQPLEVRRALAVGELARRDLRLDLVAAFEAEAERAAKNQRQPGHREVVLYVHLSASALRGHGTGSLENHGPRLVTAGTVRDWLGPTGTHTRVSVRPVVDLNVEQSVADYAIPDRIREWVVLRDRTCQFPWCTRSARSCDLDHVVPYDHDEPERGGPTSTTNLIPLCRRHHRLKTFGGWTPVIELPGVLLWRSPAGYVFRRDRHGTECLTPEPPDPPPIIARE